VKQILETNDLELDTLLDIHKSGKLSNSALLYYLRNKFTLDKAKYNKLCSIINKFKVEDDAKLSVEPLISIIIPTYNRKNMLIRAINSIFKQNYENYEIIIIDDCSTDGTKEYIQSHFEDYSNVKYYRNSKNMNAGYNRNYGYKKSKGEYIIFLDDDDFYLDENFFNKTIKKHLDYNGLSFVSSNAFIENIVKNKIELNNLNISGRVSGRKYLEKFQVEYNKPLSL